MAIDTEQGTRTVRGQTARPPASADRGVAPAPKLRRRPLLVAGSVAAVCGGALLGAFAWTATSDTSSVLAIRAGIERGAVIGQEDLMSVQVGLDPALSPVPADAMGELVGQRVRVHLWRYPRAEVPDDREGRERWLAAQWEAMDGWVGSQAVRAG